MGGLNGGYWAMSRSQSSAHARRRKLHLPARRGAVALAVATIASVGLVATGVPAGAIGVDNSGVFELEQTNPLVLDSHGKIIDSQSGLTSDPNAVDDSAAGDDWANVYAKSVDASSSDADHANVSRFLNDVVGAGDDIYFQGGSKDPNDIPAWKWTTNSVQDKNDIEHAYAARYDATTTRPAHLYFGLDRYATAGDATLGFWFLKSKIAKNADGTFSPTVHQNDDLLVQIDYTAGGAQPTVAVNRWYNGALDNIVTSNSALCGASSDQSFCATTNLHNETAPWSYNLKGTGASSTFAPRTFFEGGIDLAHFGLDQACFSSFVAETRSSQSFTSTLSDFVAGNFASCSAVESTTPSATTVSPGTDVTDTATITGRGVANAPTPNSSTTAPGTGNKVKFYLCGPIATGTCTSTASATAVPADKDLTESVPGTATATSDPVNTSSSPLATGRYCWLATWAGDTNYPDGVTGENNPAAECFTVRTIGTTTVTTPQAPSGTNVTTVAYGTTVYDHAVVTASSSGGGTITGSVAFYLCSPSQLTSGLCASPDGTQKGDITVTPVASSNPPSATADSTGTVVDQIGTWCFRAVFTPTGSTYTTSNDNASRECFTVTDTSDATSAQNWLPNDTATITGHGANTAVSGVIVIALYPTVDCTGTAVANQTYTSGTLGPAHSINFSTSNGVTNTYRVSASTSVSWKVTFTSNNANVASSSHCESTALTINNNQTQG